jgi:hypothetical protein
MEVILCIASMQELWTQTSGDAVRALRCVAPDDSIFRLGFPTQKILMILTNAHPAVVFAQLPTHYADSFPFWSYHSTSSSFGGCTFAQYKMPRRPKTRCPNCIFGVKRCDRHQRAFNPHAPTRLKLAEEKAAAKAASENRSDTSPKTTTETDPTDPQKKRKKRKRAQKQRAKHDNSISLMMVSAHHLQSALVLAKKLALLETSYLANIRSLRNSLSSTNTSIILQINPLRILLSRLYRVILITTPAHHPQSALVMSNKSTLLKRSHLAHIRAH